MKSKNKTKRKSDLVRLYHGGYVKRSTYEWLKKGAEWDNCVVYAFGLLFLTVFVLSLLSRCTS